MKKLIRLNEFLLVYTLVVYLQWLARGHWWWAAFTLLAIAVQCWCMGRNTPLWIAQVELERAQREYLLFLLRLPGHLQIRIIAYELPRVLEQTT